MTRCSELADIEWLTGDEAGVVLAELAESTGPLHSAVARLRRTFTAAQTHLLLEQVDLRRRAAAKFTKPAQMFFTRVGLEQSTDEWTARYKAQHFLSTPPFSNSTAPTVADLCCGIGGDLLALAESASAIGIDLDPIPAHFAAINTAARVLQTDVTAFDFDGVDAWHIDPDRRATGQRTTNLDYYQPDVADDRTTSRSLPKRRRQTRPCHEGSAALVGWLRARMDQPRPRVQTTRRLARQPRSQRGLCTGDRHLLRERVGSALRHGRSRTIRFPSRRISTALCLI